MCRYEKKYLDAYLTVEACVLIPLTFFLVIFIMHVTFYFYGRCLLYQDAYLLALRGSVIGESENIEAVINTESASLFGHRYFGNYIPSFELELNKSRLTLHLKNKTLRSAYDLAADSDWEYEASASSDYKNVIGHIRKLNRIYDFIKAASSALGK